MEVADIVQKWYTLASGGDIDRGDVFFRFVAVWVAFNALYTSLYGDEVGDFNQVRSFSGSPKAIDRHRELISNDVDYLAAINTLKERGVLDLSRRNWRRQIRDLNNLTEVASCLYQVRCNLFHGGKMPDNPRDERLVEAGFVIVSKLIQPFLSNTNGFAK